MKAYFHPSQDLHAPKTYFTRGQMRQPQEVADRTGQMLEGLKELGVEVLHPADQGAGPISDIHDLGYLRFLESAHRRWMEQEDWGDEVISNIFVREPNHLQGILAEAARYQA
ncbi:MAG: histone deacetylase family protein, partial [Pseudomonadota bacterium]